MHGRPRQKAGPPDPEKVKAAAQKAALFGQLAGEVLARRSALRYDAESLGLAAKLVELHPEVYTVWNYRREALQPVLDAGGEAAVAAVAGELALTERALAKNPKSYATWHHRKWVVAKGMCSLERELQLVGKLLDADERTRPLAAAAGRLPDPQLPRPINQHLQVGKLLDADERNFHGWGYRRFVVQLMGTPAARELEYAEKKIGQNFSNYSAWHSRTALLPALYGGGDAGGGDVAEALAAALASGARLGEPSSGSSSRDDPAAGKSGGGEAMAADQPQAAGEQQAAQPPATHGSAAATAAVPKEALDAEYELVKQAFWTEPEDQSGWFYHRWLLGCSLAHWEQAAGTPAEAVERAALLAVLDREQQMCEELLEIEPDAKWPLLTVVRLKELRQQVLGGSSTSGGGSSGAAAAGDAAAAAGEGGTSSSSGGLAAEIAEGYARLIELDPMRAGYYRDALEGRAHVVAKPAAPAL